MASSSNALLPASLLVVVLLGGLVVHTADALTCYNCDSRTSASCHSSNGLEGSAQVVCGKVPQAGHKAACMLKVLEDKTTKMRNTTRLCAVLNERSVDRMECKSPSDRYAVTQCDLCYDDLCNAAGRLPPAASFGTLLLLAAAAALCGLPAVQRVFEF